MIRRRPIAVGGTTESVRLGDVPDVRLLRPAIATGVNPTAGLDAAVWALGLALALALSGCTTDRPTIAAGSDRPIESSSGPNVIPVTSAPPAPQVVQGDFVRASLIGQGCAGPGDLAAVADAADAAVRSTTLAWGSDWDRALEVQLACDDVQYAAIAGSRVTAAVTVPRDTDPGHLRIVLRSSAFAVAGGAPTAAGVQARDVVLRHEMVHVATRAPFDSAIPLWLEEGIAVVQSYAGSGISQADRYADVRDALRGKTIPTKLPDDAAFRGSQAAVVYGESQVAVEVLAERLGQGELVALYREVAAGAAMNDAIARRTGWSEQEFLRRWRDRLTRVVRG